MSLQNLGPKRLQVFLTAAAAGNLSQAAASLGMSQPSLSRQIAAMEQGLGVRLFDRTGRGIELTEAGEVFVVHAREILGAMTNATSALSRLGGRVRGEVRLGLPPTVAHVLALPLIDAVRAHFPEVGITIMEGYSGHVLDWLSRGRVDIGILYTARQTTSLQADLLAEEALDLIASPETAAGLGPAVTGDRVSALPLVLPSRAHGLRQLIDARFAEHDIDLDIAMQVDAFSTTLRLVEAGEGCTILPRISVADRIAAGRLVALPLERPHLVRRILFATSPAHQPSEAVRALAAFARRHSVELFGG